MKIAIDLDNTLFENRVVEDVIDEYNLNEKLKDTLYHWDLDELGNDAQAECFERFRDPKYMCHLKPIHGTKKKIKEWAKAGHELICVTARDIGIGMETADMLRKHYPEISNIVFVGSFDKTSTYAHHKFDVVIDDSPDNVKQAISFRKTKKVYFISNKHTQYNWDFIKPLSKSKRVEKVEGIRNINL